MEKELKLHSNSLKKKLLSYREPYEQSCLGYREKQMQQMMKFVIHTTMDNWLGCCTFAKK